MLFDDLLFQTLHRVELIDPWRSPRHPSGVVGNSLLAGGVVLFFDDVALVCSSPLRSGHYSNGTAVGLADGGIGSLGYRLTLMATADAGCIGNASLYRKTVPERELLFVTAANTPPMVLLLDLARQSSGSYALRMRLASTGWCQLVYRPDLDGCIELAPADQCCTVDEVRVTSPDDTLGYLSPASAYLFALDGAYWKSAHPPGVRHFTPIFASFRKVPSAPARVSRP